MIPVFSRNKRGERRVSRPLYRLLLAAHVVVSGGWLGVVVAKLALLLAAATTAGQGASGAFHGSVGVVDGVFPPAAVATLVTGVLLSLGTKWGLLRHYWVATKLVLTVGVIVTAVGVGDRLVRPPIPESSARAVDEGTILDQMLAPTTLLVSLSAAHLIMLGVATVVSVYKPWGKTRFGRGEETVRRSAGEAAG